MNPEPVAAAVIPRNDADARMPELREVEHVVRSLRRAVLGRQILAVEYTCLNLFFVSLILQPQGSDISPFASFKLTRHPVSECCPVGRVALESSSVSIDSVAASHR